MKYLWILGFCISFFLCFLFLPMLTKLVKETSLVCENYKSETIPTGMGLAFLFTQTLTLGILSIMVGIKDVVITSYLMGFIFVGILGLLDDSIGNDKYKGLRGHIGAFFKGELTTGNIKALLGSFIALYVSYLLESDYITIFLNGLLIALFTNFMNMFDLRPGRAGKVFLIISLVLLLLSSKYEYSYIILSVLGSLIVYIKRDLRAEVMMGDTGSNILGFTLGFYAANSLSLNFKIINIIILLLLHLLAEKVSFSKIIEKNKLLNYIDMLGR